MKDTKFYVRQKLELGTIADRVGNFYLKCFVIFVLILYMYGAMSLKYVSGAESLYQGVSFLIYGSYDGIKQDIPGVYYYSISIFVFFSLVFSFGDIENSKVLQQVTSIMRVVVLFFIYGGTVYYLGVDGVEKAQTWNPSIQIEHLATVFGNTVFVFIYHHSIPGIMYPVRPQSGMNKMFMISHIVGSILLWLEG